VMKKGGLAVLIASLMMFGMSLEVESAEDTLSFNNCDNLNPPLDCPFSSNFTLSQQKEMVLEVLMEKEEMPAHKKVQEWNFGLDVSRTPYDIQLREAGTINNAWINVTSLTPSVRFKDGLFVSNSGILRTDYDYELTKPVNYYNGVENACGSPGRTNELNDCRTEYPSNKDMSYLTVFQNGNNISDKKLADFNASSNNRFESSLHIRNKILRKHWEWERGSCCRTCKEGEVTYCCAYAYTCSYAGEDYITDGLDLSDAVSAKKAIAVNSSFKLVFDTHKEPVTGYLDIEVADLQSYKLELGNAVLKRRLFSYGINYSFAPYNFLNIYAVENPWFFVGQTNVASSSTADNYERVKFETIAANLKDCRIILKGFFSEETRECNYSIMPETTLTVHTDKFNYKINEAIQASIEFVSEGAPASGNIIINYGNYSEEVYVDGKASVEFAADPSYNVIKASFESDLNKSSTEISKLIHVSGEIPLTFFFFLVITILFIAGLFKVFHKHVLEV